MKYIVYLFLVTVGSSLVGQGQMLSITENDPGATLLLEKLRKEYESFTSMEVDFDLTIQLPEQEAEVQKGKVIQQGEKYVLQLDEQAIYNDGNAIWLHIIKNNEVQINDPEMDEEEGMMSPKDMLTVYESGDFVYSITDHPKIDGISLTKIDFKPLSSDSDYFKITLLLTKAENKMHEMKVFSKDGSRYSLKINNIVSNKDYDAGIFTFDESKYPDIYIEDLRID